MTLAHQQIIQSPWLAASLTESVRFYAALLALLSTAEPVGVSETAAVGERLAAACLVRPGRVGAVTGAADGRQVTRLWGTADGRGSVG